MLTVKIESFLQKKGEETSLHYAPVKKVALTKAFGLQFEHIRVNTQNVMSFIKFSLVIEYCIYWFIFIKILCILDRASL